MSGSGKEENMNGEKLKDILDKHLKWLRNENGGTRADLYGANLYGANLTGANLTWADLTRADLYGADLTGADLTRANLTRANLTGANLTGANLTRADLYGANLTGANLYGANLTGANLTGANFTWADLTGAKIDIELLNKFFPIACPESGSFVGWKKCKFNTVVKLEILADAKRSSAYSRKCRCSAAKVLAIENADGTPYKDNKINSIHDDGFWYTVGEVVKVDDFDNDRRNECAPGIHFFITRQEAVDW